MILYINTQDQKKVTVSVKDKSQTVESMSEENEYGSQALLPLIEKLIRSHTPGVSTQIHSGSAHWEILDAIEVETGPGSFTGVRVGVSVANALAFSLEIPVNGKKIETTLKY